MERLTYRGTPQITEDGLVVPSYSDYPTRRIIEKLAEYEDLEEEDLLLHLPCKIGTTVYHVVKSLSYGEVGDKPEVNYRISEVNFNLFMFNFIGESIFLTKEEAEQKLKELTT